MLPQEVATNRPGNKITKKVPQMSSNTRAAMRPNLQIDSTKSQEKKHQETSSRVKIHLQ